MATNEHNPIEPEIAEALDRFAHHYRFGSRQRMVALLKYLVEKRNELGPGVSAKDIANKFHSSPETARTLVAKLRESLARFYFENPEAGHLQIVIPRANASDGYRLTFNRTASHPQPQGIKGDKVRELRAAKRLTQEQLAERVGLSLRTIQSLESGNAIAGWDTLFALAGFFEVPPDELMLDTARAVEPSSAGDPESDFDIHFDPQFAPEEVKDILTALANYYRSCGGAGFELNLEPQETTVKEPAHV
jgi:transcriptional regulator with XRE-family HTH domain